MSIFIKQGGKTYKITHKLRWVERCQTITHTNEEGEEHISEIGTVINVLQQYYSSEVGFGGVWVDVPTVKESEQ